MTMQGPLPLISLNLILRGGFQVSRAAETHGVTQLLSEGNTALIKVHLRFI